MIKAKFKVAEMKRVMGMKKVDSPDPNVKSEWVPCEIQTVILCPVTGGSDENKKFWEATPTGRIELGVINQDAWKEFELDKEYYVDFSKV